MNVLFTEWKLKRLRIKNRLVRSATIEGMADEVGNPTPALGRLYAELASGGVGTIITGFSYVAPEGRSMHPGQCGIESDARTAPWSSVVEAAKGAAPDVTLLMQIAHTGRQTLSRVTGYPPLAPSRGRSPYFLETPRVMSERDIQAALDVFGAAALRAKQAGFDGIQLHAAHGYLIHQFLSPARNRRIDRWGRDRLLFLREAILRVRESCGGDFPIFLKVSAGEHSPHGLNPDLAGLYLAGLEDLGIEAAEISYGTMDHAFDIFRGAVPIGPVFEHNILFNRKPKFVLGLMKRFILPRMKAQFIPYTENYNLEPARRIRSITSLPLILVGGIRDLASMEAILDSGDADALALCRPLLREPDLGNRFKEGRSRRSTCTNCNLCAVMVDSPKSLQCFSKPTREEELP